MYTINDRLRLWRTSLGQTQEKFAEAIGSHVGMVRKYEAGSATPGGEVLAAMGRTGLNVHWLLTGEGHMEWKLHHHEPGVTSLAAASASIAEEGEIARKTSALLKGLWDDGVDWLPGSIEISELLQLVDRANEILQYVADGKSRRVGRLTIDRRVVDAALRLGFERLRSEWESAIPIIHPELLGFSPTPPQAGLVPPVAKKVYAKSKRS